MQENGNPRWQTAENLIDSWRHEVLEGEPPTLYRVGKGSLASVEIGPGLITAIGGAPGAGKTAFAMQTAFEILLHHDDARLLVCNVEMPMATLVERQIARLSGVTLNDIRHRSVHEDDRPAVAAAFETLAGFADRLAWVAAPPFTTNAVRDAGCGHDANVVVLDYIQQVQPAEETGDARQRIDAVMSELRQFSAGAAIIAVSAVSRQRDSKGSNGYSSDALNLASFGGSSGIEYNADSGYVLHVDKEDEDYVVLKHVKARHSGLCDVRLEFDRQVQQFTPGDAGVDIGNAIVPPELAAMWEGGAE